MKLNISETTNNWKLKFHRQIKQIISKLMKKKFRVSDKSFLLNKKIFFVAVKIFTAEKNWTSKSQNLKIVETWNFPEKARKLFPNWWWKKIDIRAKSFFQARNYFFLYGDFIHLLWNPQNIIRNKQKFWWKYSFFNKQMRLLKLFQYLRK